MDGFTNIKVKLEQFQRKYYTRVLLEGILLFVALAGLTFLFVLGLEYFLWLSSGWRLMLLLLLLLTTGFLLVRYILFPLAKLLKLKKGISDKEAARMIGNHFPEVGDKLTNLVDLAENKGESDLLLASIRQRSENLSPIPFTRAIHLSESLRYSRYLIIPGIIVLALLVSGSLREYFGSYKRVVNYAEAFEPPAPFEFHVISGDLKVLETEEVTVSVYTSGEVQPENIYIHINGSPVLLSRDNDRYTHRFRPPLQSVEFYFEADGIRTRTYELVALKTPSIRDFSLELGYPAYTGLQDEVLKGTGNATFPEGTRVRWLVNSDHTEEIELVTADTVQAFTREESEFKLAKSVYNSLAYELVTSNSNIARFERLAYRFKVIKDAYPAIKATHVRDSLNPNIHYFLGEASDDYLLEEIDLIVMEQGGERPKTRINLLTPEQNFTEFYYTFPSGINLEPGKKYELYFEALDNDGLRNGKRTKTQTFLLEILEEGELQEQRLDNQESLIKGMDKAIEEFKKQQEDLEELNQKQKEKSNLDFNDESEVLDFLKKQQTQEKLMQKFSRELKEHIEENKENSPEDELLKERLERREEEARKNEKLLEELRKIADKIDKETLQERLEELGKQQQKNARSLEQLLELTKRYYVTERAAQLARELEKLADKQEELSEKELKELAEKKEQAEMNSEFKKMAENLEELARDNEELKKPLPLDIDENKKERIKEEQQEAQQEIEQSQSKEGEKPQNNPDTGQKVSQKQKSAARKMREMSEALQQSGSAAGGGSTIAEDAEMLRQILDNLVIFSFKQEQLYDRLQDFDSEMASFSATVREQNELKALFEHIDDSLFALSLRQAEISELVNEQITEVYYNTDKALESMAENRMYQGASYQQYVLNAANTLADFLADLLENMQQSLSMGQGSGSSGNEFQLPDIIKGQGELQGKMQGMMKGKEGGEKGQEEGNEGEDNGGREGDQEGEQGDQKGDQGTKGEGDNGQSRGSGNDGEGDDGKQGTDGESMSEAELQELYEIYKEQERLRNALEEQLEDMLQEKDKELAAKLLRQMEDFERDLIENGITQRTLDKINRIQHQLLKLENAALKQGEKRERESETNENQFNNPITTKPGLQEKLSREIEILNRQALPLRPAYRDKVRKYFKSND